MKWIKRAAAISLIWVLGSGLAACSQAPSEMATPTPGMGTPLPTGSPQAGPGNTPGPGDYTGFGLEIYEDARIQNGGDAALCQQLMLAFNQLYRVFRTADITGYDAGPVWLDNYMLLRFMQARGYFYRVNYGGITRLKLVEFAIENITQINDATYVQAVVEVYYTCQQIITNNRWRADYSIMLQGGEITSIRLNNGSEMWDMSGYYVQLAKRQQAYLQEHGKHASFEENIRMVDEIFDESLGRLDPNNEWQSLHRMTPQAPKEAPALSAPPTYTPYHDQPLLGHALLGDTATSDGEYAYYIKRTPQELMDENGRPPDSLFRKAWNNQSAAELVYAGCNGQLNYHRGFVYFRAEDNRLMRYDIAGGQVEVYLDTPVAMALSIGDWLYYIEQQTVPSPEPHAHNILKARNLVDGSEQVIVDDFSWNNEFFLKNKGDSLLFDWDKNGDGNVLPYTWHPDEGLLRLDLAPYEGIQNVFCCLEDGSLLGFRRGTNNDGLYRYPAGDGKVLLVPIKTGETLSWFFPAKDKLYYWKEGILAYVDYETGKETLLPGLTGGFVYADDVRLLGGSIPLSTVSSITYLDTYRQEVFDALS
nr:hypothetical protein [bacterium]